MKVAAVVLTWNNVNETIDCVKSLLKLEGELLSKILVVDNASETKFQKLLESSLREFDESIAIIEEDEIEKLDTLPPSFLILVKNRENYGYAGGNNRGLKLAFKDSEVKYIWILNNDTVVDKNSLVALVERAEESGAAFTGSVLLYYNYPAVIQAVGGGKFYPWLGGAILFYKGKKIHSKRFKNLTPSRVEKRINYIMGASILVKREVIEDVGLMDEIFFLYGDEVDWQLRAAKRGWRIAVALDSRVYHRESMSIGRKTPFYFYHFSLSSAILVKRHFSSIFLPPAFTALLLRALFSRNFFENVPAMVRGFFEGTRVI